MITTAKLCQKAENEFIGVNCGIMDQFAIAMGKKDECFHNKPHQIQRLLEILHQLKSLKLPLDR